MAYMTFNPAKYDYSPDYMNILLGKQIEKESTATELQKEYERNMRLRERAHKEKMGVYIGEPDTLNILADLGEKEDKMNRSLLDNKVKEVIIKCEDGTTYNGKIERITGNPYNIYEMEVEARITGRKSKPYGIDRVIFQNPATIVYWTDGTKTVVNCMDNVEVKKKTVDGKEITVRKPRKCDSFSKEVGLAMAIAKKWAGNEGNYNNIFREYADAED